MKKRPSDERRKLTFKKCKQRFDLFNNIIVGGSAYDADYIHKYAKRGMKFMRYEMPMNIRDMRNDYAMRSSIADYYIGD